MHLIRYIISWRLMRAVTKARTPAFMYIIMFIVRYIIILAVRFPIMFPSQEHNRVPNYVLLLEANCTGLKVRAGLIDPQVVAVSLAA